jgi:hypothetical protein
MEKGGGGGKFRGVKYNMKRFLGNPGKKALW